MKCKNPMLVVSDMERSVDFYRRVLGLRVVMDFGANKTLTGGLALQTLESWRGFLATHALSFGGRDAEVYFEEEDFNGFVDRLSGLAVDYVRRVREHAWGQRVVRLYDPDRHIIEVGESLKAVCRRFLDSGLTPEQTAARMDVPLKFVRGCLR